MKLKRKISEIMREKGSATIEAVVSFTAFLFVIFTILNVINVCRAQMLVSNAMDTVAKELSQYSYFYEISGLSKFSKDLNAQAEVGANNINQVIGTVDTLYSTAAKSADNSVQHMTNVTNGIQEGTADLSTIQRNLQGIANNGRDIKTAISSMTDSFNGVMNNPMAYLKSIAAVAGNEALDLAKSHALAAPLARAMMAKHFGSNMDEVNKALERLGIEGGLSAMNFNMSTAFASDSPEELHLVVIYKVKLFEFFKGLDLEATLCKHASARAWLGGDNVIIKVTPAPDPTPEPEDENDGNKPAGEENEEQKEKTGEEGEEKPSEGEAPSEKEEVDIEGSYWHMPNDYEHNDQQWWAFYDLFNSQYEADSPNLIPSYGGSEVGYRLASDYADNPYNVAYGYNYCVDASSFSSTIALDLHDMKEHPDKVKVDLSKVYALKQIVYVPNNIPDTEYEKIEKEIKKEMDEYRLWAEQGLVPDNISPSIEIVKAGGNYNYGG